MGSIKNIVTYIEEALEAANASNTQVKLVLRESEGMLKNMANHESALVAQFSGMRIDNTTDVSLDAAGSECLALGESTNFPQVDFANAHQRQGSPGPHLLSTAAPARAAAPS